MATFFFAPRAGRGVYSDQSAAECREAQHIIIDTGLEKTNWERCRYYRPAQEFIPTELQEDSWEDARGQNTAPIYKTEISAFVNLRDPAFLQRPLAGALTINHFALSYTF